MAKIDIVGMGLSVACAIHCLAAPVLLSTLPLVGIEFLGHEGFESIMIAMIAVLAGFAFFKGHHKHGRKAHFIFGGFGLLVFLLLRPSVSAELEPFATVLGGSAFVIGHFLNWKWSKPCEECECE
jgi:hypothetical protein